MNSRIKKFIDKDLNNPKSGHILDLSDEKLTNSDYNVLTDILEKTSYLESLKLPPLSKKNAEAILIILNQSTAKNTTLTYIDINLSRFLGAVPENIDSHRKQIQSRIQRNKKRIFGIHGGGNIGLGTMADVVSQSPFKYHVVGTSSDKFFNDLINSTHQLWLQHGSVEKSKITCVKNVSMVSREEQDIVKLYTDANILAICLTPGALASTARDIAKGLITRYRTDKAGLKILVLMNIPKCDQFVREKVTNELSLLTQNQDEADKILSVVQFVPTVVDRIVNRISLEDVKDKLRKQLLSGASYDFINSNESLLKQIDNVITIPEMLSEAIVKFNLQFNLYNAEKEFALYIPDILPEALRFPAAKVVKNLDQLEAVKNKYINGPHAIVAWLGALMGYKTIAEAINHPGMIRFIDRMMEQEIQPALRAAYSDISIDELLFLKNLFFERCKNSIDDPVVRVGRDPLRKLDSGGRIRGTIELCQRHNLKISTPALEQGIAAAILYAIKKIDPSNPGCQKILEIYEKNGKSYEAVLCYKGPYPSGIYSGFDPNRDRSLIDNILLNVSQLEKYYEMRNRKPPSPVKLYSQKEAIHISKDVSCHRSYTTKEQLSHQSLFSRKLVDEFKEKKSESNHLKYISQRKP